MQVTCRRSSNSDGFKFQQAYLNPCTCYQICWWCHCDYLCLYFFFSTGISDCCGLQEETKRHHRCWRIWPNQIRGKWGLSTVRCRYNAVNFITNSHKRHPMARPLGQGMGCLLWIQHLIDIMSQFLQLLMQNLTILDRVIKALDCISLCHLATTRYHSQHWPYHLDLQ